MSKDRDLVDYLKLGNDLIQTSRLGSLAEAQRASAIVNAAKLEADQREAETRLREDNIREFVFSAAKLVEGLERLHATSNPSGTLVTMCELARHIEDLNVKPSSVRTYDDKEKVHAFLSNVRRVIGDCEKRLDPAALQDVKTCMKYRAENGRLKELLCYKARQQITGDQDELPQTKASKICDYCGGENDQNAENCRQCGQDQFRAVGNQNAQEEDNADGGFEAFEKASETPVLLRFLAILGAILIPPGLLAAMAAGKLPRLGDDAILSLVLYGVGAAAVVFLLAKFGADKSSRENPQPTVAENPQQRAREELALIMDRQRVRLLEKDFGTGDFNYHKNLYLNRTALISKVMAYDDSEWDADFFLRNSCEGENLLERTPAMDAPVLVFGKNAPRKGWFYSGSKDLPDLVNLELARSGNSAWKSVSGPLDSSAHRRRYIKFLIDRGYILCFKIDDRIVIFTRLKFQIPREGIESLKRLMDVTPETVVDCNGCVEPAARIFANDL